AFADTVLLGHPLAITVQFRELSMAIKRPVSICFRVIPCTCVIYGISEVIALQVKIHVEDRSVKYLLRTFIKINYRYHQFNCITNLRRSYVAPGGRPG